MKKTKGSPLSSLIVVLVSAVFILVWSLRGDRKVDLPNFTAGVPATSTHPEQGQRAAESRATEHRVLLDLTLMSVKDSNEEKPSDVRIKFWGMTEGIWSSKVSMRSDGKMITTEGQESKEYSRPNTPPGLYRLRAVFAESDRLDDYLIEIGDQDELRISVRATGTLSIWSPNYAQYRRPPLVYCEHAAKPCGDGYSPEIEVLPAELEHCDLMLPNEQTPPKVKLCARQGSVHVQALNSVALQVKYEGSVVQRTPLLLTTVAVHPFPWNQEDLRIGELHGLFFLTPPGAEWTVRVSNTGIVAASIVE